MKRKKGSQELVSRSVGRPTKYDPDFHPEDFLRLSKQGKVLVQIALEWDIDTTTIYEWQTKHPEFSQTVKKGQEFSKGWYINLGQAAMVGKIKDPVTGKPIIFNLGAYVWLTKNLFDWAEKHAIKEDRPMREVSNEELERMAAEEDKD